MADPAITHYFIMFFEKLFLSSCTIEDKFIDTWKDFKSLLIKNPVDMTDIHNFVSDMYGLKFPSKNMQIILEQPEVNKNSDSGSVVESEETIDLPELDKQNLQFVPSLNLNILTDCSNFPSKRKISERDSLKSSMKDDLGKLTMRDSIGKISLRTLSPQRKIMTKNKFKTENMTPNERYIRDSESFWDELDNKLEMNPLKESPILLKMKKFELEASITSARNIFKYERPKKSFEASLELKKVTDNFLNTFQIHSRIISTISNRTLELEAYHDIMDDSLEKIMNPSTKTEKTRTKREFVK